jgi:signal transduction histidine kinase
LNWSKRTYFILNLLIINIFIITFALTTSYLTHDPFFSLGIGVITILLTLLLYKPLMEPYIDRDKKLDAIVKETLHEINIPISTIKANLQMLRSKELDQKTKMRLMRIDDATEQLITLYEDMEHEIKSESFKEETEPFELKTLVDEIIKKQSDIQGTISITNHLQPITLQSDKKELTKVLSNLLSNAIKYNRPNGTIAIYLDNFNLIIEDSGIGMRDDEILKIHEKYYQVDNTYTGMGLGLHIVKSFCEKNGLEMKITSTKEVGTKVAINILKLTLV